MSPLDFQGLFKNLPYPMAVLSPDLRILDCNLNYQNIVGTDLIGQKVSTVLETLFTEAEKTQELKSSLNRALSEKVKTSVSDLKLGTQDFKSVHFPILNPGGAVQFIVHSFEDCSQLYNCQKELDVFCSTISHDLRAPLRSLSSFTQILAERYFQSVDPQALHFLNRISIAAIKMSSQIEGLVQYTRLGRQDINRRTISLSEIVENQLRAFQQASPERKFEIKCAEGIIVNGDSELLKIAIKQLLSNAFKFSKNKEISKIEFGVRDVDSERTFFIHDNGDGFSMDYVKKLFGFFQRLHSEEFEGVGMGLAIAQRVIRNHGGRIWAEGSAGQGSTFYFTLGHSS